MLTRMLARTNARTHVHTRTHVHKHASRYALSITSSLTLLLSLLSLFPLSLIPPPPLPSSPRFPSLPPSLTSLPLPPNLPHSPQLLIKGLSVRADHSHGYHVEVVAVEVERMVPFGHEHHLHRVPEVHLHDVRALAEVSLAERGHVLGEKTDGTDADGMGVGFPLTL